MEFHTELAFRHREWVREHPEMDALRKEQCMCFHCLIMEQCPAAAKLYAIACKYDMAFAITRCRAFISKDECDGHC